ncbi:hypothetical protein BGW80DRAFT_1255845 [Lactifluus volemus]|nr:hypothetical protein BGW80DRAFT_1255845 [Lactifluus volemus]
MPRDIQRFVLSYIQLVNLDFPFAWKVSIFGTPTANLQADDCGVQSQALQLLESLVKGGSERVVDDARSHIPNSQKYCGGPGVPMCGIAQWSSWNFSPMSMLMEFVKSVKWPRRIVPSTSVPAMMDSPFGCGGRFGGFGSESMGSYSGDYGWSTSGYDRATGNADDDFADFQAYNCGLV